MPLSAATYSYWIVPLAQRAFLERLARLVSDAPAPLPAGKIRRAVMTHLGDGLERLARLPVLLVQPGQGDRLRAEAAELLRGGNALGVRHRIKHAD